MKKKRILILGVTGMLGHILFSELSKNEEYEIFGTARELNNEIKCFYGTLIKNIKTGVDVTNFNTVLKIFAEVQPTTVINCIGLIKQQPNAQDPLIAIKINAELPHSISLLCKAVGARMIHFSTDCVFDGKVGNYTEEHISDAIDLYGRTKYLGEVNYPHSITLRTSIIGHELKGRYGLVEWFLAQQGSIKGFTNAIYSGFPTNEMAHIISEYIIPNDKLSGVYHVSSNPISKYDLLNIVKKIYKKEITIKPYDDFVCNRALNSERFQKETGYIPPQWEKLVFDMYKNFSK